jgi:tRNA 5-methylaminomethyl-2-thiouridine biosynthesis bifunctional protein
MNFKKLNNGELYSEIYEDIYWSKEGGLAEKEYVFLNGNSVSEKWLEKENYNILELGFGAGLNFLSTWRLWNSTSSPNSWLSFFSIEKHPIPINILEDILSDFPEINNLSSKLIPRLSNLQSGFNLIIFPESRISLTIGVGDVLDILKDYSGQVDAFFLDGFSPQKNPDMWSEKVFQRLSQIGKNNSTFSTYSSSTLVRENAVKAGFEIEILPGFAVKKRMLKGVLVKKEIQEGSLNDIYKPTYNKFPSKSKVCIIGGGLAGCNLARAFSKRGFKSDIYEKNSSIASEASGNPAGIFSPVIAMEKTTFASLANQGFTALFNEIKQLEKMGYSIEWKQIGVHDARYDESEIEKFQKGISLLGIGNELVELSDKEYTISSNQNKFTARGFYFNQSAWINPKSLCNALLDSSKENVNIFLNTKIDKIEKSENEWKVFSNGKELSEIYDIVVFANSYQVDLSPYTSWIQLQKLRGQICYIDPTNMPVNFDSIIIHPNGYVNPIGDMTIVGSTYDTIDDPNVDPKLNEKILTALSSFTPGISWENEKIIGAKIGFRAKAADQLPIAGQLPLYDDLLQDYKHIWKSRQKFYPTAKIESGLFILSGLGSHGFIFSHILAEYIASIANGEPSPIPEINSAAVHPARFIIRDLIRRKIKVADGG